MRLGLTRGALLAGAVLAHLASGTVTGAATHGTLKGRVINETTRRAQAGVKVTLTAASEGGVVGSTRTVTTDGDGRYLFRRLETGDDLFYALDARFDGGLFSGRPISIPDDTPTPPVITSTLRVWATTTDSSAITVTRDYLFAVPASGELAVIQTVRVMNAGDGAYIGRGGGGDGAPRESLGFSLPAGARVEGLAIRDASMDIPEIVPTSYGFGTTAAIPPGEMRITYSYDIAGAGGAFDLSRTALYPTTELAMFVPDPFEVESAWLARDERVTVGGRAYTRYSSREPLEAGDPLQAQAIARAQGGLGLGTVAVAALLLGGVLYSVTRLQRGTRRSPRTRPDSQQKLLEEIAELDIRYSTGEVDKDQWSTLREQLKEKAAAMSRDES